MATFKAAGYRVFGASMDEPGDQAVFSAEFGFKFPLLTLTKDKIKSLGLVSFFLGVFLVGD